MTRAVIVSGGPIFDGETLRDDCAAVFMGGVLDRICPREAAPEGRHIHLNGDILSPGFVDLQVNGGGGVMIGDAGPDTLRTVAAAHRTLGTTRFLPTLITDTPERTRAVLDCVEQAIADGVGGIAGLHLEGPHLSLARNGAHDAALIRPMQADDQALLTEAAQRIPVLKVTLAPENASLSQVAALAEAGVIVALGHTDADHATCLAYARAGARCVTHLFNAMSQLGSREPGLVGAGLSDAGLTVGLIADGIHVHPATMAIAWRTKPPGGIYLVSDAMAVAGTALEGFDLGGRHIQRRNGSLRLADGTLAGADLDLTTALRVLVTRCGVELQDALRAATRTPAEMIGLSLWSAARDRDFIRIRRDLSKAVPLIAD